MNKELEILDGILKYLLNNGNNSFSSIKDDDKLKNEFSQEVENNTLASAFDKLVKDGYVNVNEQTRGINMNKTPYVVECYNISFEGIFFINNGGYEKEHENNQKAEIESAELKRRQFLLEEKHSSIQGQIVFLTLVIAIGTLIPAVYYIIEILEFFGVLNSCSCNN
jgi:hypothetical protein